MLIFVSMLSSPSARGISRRITGRRIFEKAFVTPHFSATFTIPEKKQTAPPMRKQSDTASSAPDSSAAETSSIRPDVAASTAETIIIRNAVTPSIFYITSFNYIYFFAENAKTAL